MLYRPLCNYIVLNYSEREAHNVDDDLETLKQLRLGRKEIKDGVRFGEVEIDLELECRSPWTKKSMGVQHDSAKAWISYMHSHLGIYIRLGAGSHSLNKLMHSESQGSAMGLSRERLVKALRAMNAGDAADQVMRQLDKIIRNNEHVSHDPRMNKDDLISNHLHISGDVTKKRVAAVENEDHTHSSDIHSKRLRYGPHDNSTTSVTINDDVADRGNGMKPPAIDEECRMHEFEGSVHARHIGSGHW